MKESVGSGRFPPLVPMSGRGPYTLDVISGTHQTPRHHTDTGSSRRSPASVRTPSASAMRLPAADTFHLRSFFNKRQTDKGIREGIAVVEKQCVVTTTAEDEDVDLRASEDSAVKPRQRRTITVVMPSHQARDEDNDTENDNEDKNGNNRISRAIARDEDERRIDRKTSDVQFHFYSKYFRDPLLVPARRDGFESERQDSRNVDERRSQLYRLRYVHFDQNRAAAGHARQIVNRLREIKVRSRDLKQFHFY